MERIDGVLLAGVGVLLVHQFAYTASALAGIETTGAHGHLGTAWLVGSFAALIVLARSIARSVRERNLQVNALPLAALIGGGYALMEGVERIVDGHSLQTLFEQPVFWLGLAAAPLLALALHAAITTVEQILASVLSNDEPLRVRASRLCPAPTVRRDAVPAVVLVHSAPRRGPPTIR